MDEEPTDFARTFRAALHSWYADGGADSCDNLVVAANVFNAHQIFAELSKEPRRSALIKARYATFNERGSWIVDADLVRLTLGSDLYGPPPDRLVRLAGFHLGIRRGRGIDMQALQRRSLLEEPQDDVVMKEPAHFRRSVRQRTVKGAGASSDAAEALSSLSLAEPPPPAAAEQTVLAEPFAGYPLLRAWLELAAPGDRIEPDSELRVELLSFLYSLARPQDWGVLSRRDLVREIVAALPLSPPSPVDPVEASAVSPLLSVLMAAPFEGQAELVQGLLRAGADPLRRCALAQGEISPAEVADGLMPGLLPALRGWESDAPDISGVRLPPNYSHLESIRDEIDFVESTRVDAVRCLNHALLLAGEAKSNAAGTIASCPMPQGITMADVDRERHHTHPLETVLRAPPFSDQAWVLQRILRAGWEEESVYATACALADARLPGLLDVL